MLRLGNLKSIINVATLFAKQHSPELLVGLGIAGMATSTILAVKATPKAIEKIDEEIEAQNDKLLADAVANQQENYSPVNKLKPTEVAKVCWKDYAPAAVTGVASIVCIIGGTHINLRRNAALVTAVKLSEATIKDLQNYKNKVVETIGQEKNDEIEEKVDKEVVNKASSTLDMSIVPGNGPILCLEKIGGQWFRSDRETIREAINRLNYIMNDDMYVSLNDFYDEMRIPQTVAGRDLGWNRDCGLIEPKFSSQLLPNGEPVLVFTTRIEPRVDYSKLY